jgi:hypothetical protein
MRAHCPPLPENGIGRELSQDGEKLLVLPGDPLWPAPPEEALEQVVLDSPPREALR